MITKIIIITLVSILALSLLLTYLLGLIETMILTAFTLLGSVAYLIVKCRTLANKCFDVNKQLILPLNEYINPIQELKYTGAKSFLAKLISFKYPFIYNIIGLSVGIIAIVLYKRDIQSSLDEKEKAHSNLITRLQIAKKLDNKNRQKKIKDILNKQQKQCDNKIAQYKEDEAKKVEAIKAKKINEIKEDLIKS